MDFGAILKRSWQITWRYKALWILGIFAGVSGCAGGGGGGGNSVGSDIQDSMGIKDLSNTLPDLGAYIPLAIAAAVLLLVLSIIFWVLAVAARGGLVTGVSEIEEQRPRTLGEMWSAGFAKLPTLIGLELLLKGPLVIIGVVVFIVVVLTVVSPLFHDAQPGPGVAVGLCGSLAIGVPLLLVGSLILGVMHLVALRYVMLGGRGAIQAAGDSWHFLRARLKDTALLWLLNLALNIAASFAVLIPAFFVGVVVAVPFLAAVSARSWEALIVIGSVVFVLVMLIAIAYNAVWGTYTSALWTLFFRRATGLHVEPAVAQSPSAPWVTQPAPAPPAAGPELGPPMAPMSAPPAETNRVDD